MVTKHDHLGVDTAARILHDSPNRVILVDADATSEGAFVAGLALLDHRPEHIILRSTKVMSDNPWTSTVYRSRLNSPEEVKEILDRLPVDAVLLDLTNPGWEQDNELLLRALRSDPECWRLTNDMQVSPGATHHLQIYRKRQTAPPGFQRRAALRTCRRDPVEEAAMMKRLWRILRSFLAALGLILILVTFTPVLEVVGQSGLTGAVGGREGQDLSLFWAEISPALKSLA